MGSILLTGGTGYIASHTAVALLEAGYDAVAVDNLSNSERSVIDRLEKLEGRRIRFYEGDVRDRELLDRIFSENEIDAVIHFAGLKAVGESVSKPLEYYDNNLNATICLLKAMLDHGVNRLVFSSSATVYSDDNGPQKKEGMRLGCTNPYGWTKFMGEQIIRDTCAANPQFRAVNLRYFNPVGAHPSALIGENPRGIPNNLVPYIQQVASGRREFLNVYGDDYDTPDGTGVRDYIHVCDLADAHVAAMRYLEGHEGCSEINIGTGRGTSVLEMVRAFETANGVEIPYRVAPRRPGDVDSNYANADLAEEVLGWKAKRNVEDMCRDAYRWQMALENGLAD